MSVGHFFFLFHKWQIFWGSLIKIAFGRRCIMSDPLVFISKWWADTTKNGRVFGAAGVLLSSACCPFAVWQAHYSAWLRIRGVWLTRSPHYTYAAYAATLCASCCRAAQSPQPYSLQTVCVKLCLLYDLSNTSLCGERCARVSSAIPTICFICLCLLSSSLDSLTVADQQRRRRWCSTGRC